MTEQLSSYRVKMTGNLQAETERERQGSKQSEIKPFGHLQKRPV